MNKIFILLTTSLLFSVAHASDLFTCQIIKISNGVEVLNTAINDIKHIDRVDNTFKSGDYNITLTFFLNAEQLDSNLNKIFKFNVDTLEAKIKNVKSSEELYLTATVKTGSPLISSIQVDDSTGKENSLEITCVKSKDLSGSF